MGKRNKQQKDGKLLFAIRIKRQSSYQYRVVCDVYEIPIESETSSSLPDLPSNRRQELKMSNGLNFIAF